MLEFALRAGAGRVPLQRSPCRASPPVLSREGCRRAAGLSPKPSGKMALVGETRQQRNFGQRQVAFREQGLGPADPALFDILYRAHIHAALEQPGEVKAADIDEIGEVSEPNGALDVRFDILGQPFEIGSSERRRVMLVRRLEDIVPAQHVRGERAGQRIGDERLGRMRRAFEFGHQQQRDAFDDGITRLENIADFKLRPAAPPDLFGG